MAERPEADNLHVNRFERGAPADPNAVGSNFEAGYSMPHRRGGAQTPIFPIESNIHYRFDSAEDLLNDLSTLAAVIQHHHEIQCSRLSILDDYYKGRNTLLYQDVRRADGEKSDHRISHNFAKVIAQFKVGYTTSNPIKVESEEEAVQDVIGEFNRRNDVDALNTELMLDVSKYGRAYELQLRSEEDEDCLYISNVFETFVIYDKSIERKPILGVRYCIDQSINGLQHSEKTVVTIYTAEKMISFQPCPMSSLRLMAEKEQGHRYGAVPIVEYANNRYRMSDYEDCIPLIDAYDQAVSDAANFIQDVNDSVLVLSGDFKSTDFDFKLIERQLKENNMLPLQTGNDVQGRQTKLDAYYVTPEFTLSETEQYKERLRKDIFALSNIPDMTDEKFSGNSSGVAMKYKTFGFEQSIIKIIPSQPRWD